MNKAPFVFTRHSFYELRRILIQLIHYRMTGCIPVDPRTITDYEDILREAQPHHS